MSNKIYLITQGSYYDYRVIGYTETEDEAKKIIEDHNKGLAYGKYDYEECEKWKSYQL